VRAADLAAAEALTESDSAQPPEPKPDLPSQRAPTPTSNPKKPSRTPPSAPTIKLPPPKYHVARTAQKNLPIYTDFKRGGNLHLTTVRKITGDAAMLRDELAKLLDKKEGEVTINNVNGHVTVKGHHVKERIAEFLEQRGM
jgi:large subunit ribosomal protein L49